MKHVHGNGLVLGAAAFVFLAAQPVSAQTTQITEVKLNPGNGGLSVVLKTSAGSSTSFYNKKRQGFSCRYY